MSAAGAVVSEVFLVLTKAPDMTTLTTSSDIRGHFSFPAGVGEYMLLASAPRFKPVRRRILIGVGQSDSALVITLEPLEQSTALKAITIVASRPEVQTPSGLVVGTGAKEGLVDGSAATMSPFSQTIGDITRTSLNGTSGVDGFAVAGLNAAESQVQLNGLLFRGVGLPGLLPTRIRVAASSYDVSNSGFSGGLVSIEIPQADEFRDLKSAVSAAGQSNPTNFRNSASILPALLVDIGGSSRFREQKSGISFGSRLSARRQSVGFFNEMTDEALQELGADPIIARTLASALQSEFPRREIQGRFHDLAYNWTLLARIDPRIKPTSSNSFVVGATLSSEPISASSPLSVRASTAGLTRSEINFQWNRSDVTKGFARWDNSAALAISRMRSTDKSAGLANLRVRTSPSLATPNYGATLTLDPQSRAQNSDRLVLELKSQRDVLVGARRNHQQRIVFGLRLDELEIRRPGWNGALTFASLEDFSANSAELTTTDSTGNLSRATALKFGGGFGDEWRARPSLKLQYGLRVDGSGIVSRDVAGFPRRLTLQISPRIGGSWQFRPPTEGEGYSRSSLFSRHLVPAGMLRGGVGLFHRDAEPDLAMRYSTPFGDVSSQTCFGGSLLRDSDNILDPQYLRTACAASGQSTIVSSRVVAAESFAPPFSLRATSNYLTHFKSMDVDLSMLWNAGFRQARIVGTKSAMVPFFTLPQEGNREFFMAATDIDERHGVPRVEAGVRSGQKLQIAQSDLRSRTLQTSVQVSPRWGDARRVVRLGYVFTRSSSLQSGWESDVFGDPDRLRWDASRTVPTHQWQIEVGKSVSVVDLTLWVRAQSGVPYVPLVAGDVNGDGIRTNDRAYVPTTSEQSPQLWSAIRKFEETSPKSVRNCLDVVRKSAFRGHCDGPWQANSALAGSIELRSIHLADRGLLSFFVDNVTGFAGSVLGWEGLGNWGRRNVDTYLVRPISFNREARAFSYQINPRFGAESNGRRIGVDGYRITLALQLPLAASIQNQQIKAWLKNKGVGTRIHRDTLALRLARNVPALYDMIFLESEELLLQRDQIEILTARQRKFDEQVALKWNELASKLSSLPQSFDVDEAVPLVQLTTDAVWELNRLEANRLRDVLTPIQQELLPSTARMLVRATKPISQRIVFY